MPRGHYIMPRGDVIPHQINQNNFAHMVMRGDVIPEQINQHNFAHQQPINNFVYKPPIRCNLKSDDFTVCDNLLRNNLCVTCNKPVREHEIGRTIQPILNAHVLSTLNSDIKPDDSVSVANTDSGIETVIGHVTMF